MKTSHKTIGALALLVAVGLTAVSFAQDSQRGTARNTQAQILPSIKKLMSHEEFQKAVFPN